MAIQSLAVEESPRSQGYKEEQAYKLTTTPWGASPTSQSNICYDITNGDERDVTATVLPTNSPTVAANVITSSLVKSLTPGHTYRLYFIFATGGNKYAAHLVLLCPET
jgi:hypothetical protein